MIVNNKFILKVCNEINEERIAIIAIGNCPVFLHLNGIANSLQIPFISIKWESMDEEISTLTNNNFYDETNSNPIKLNIHPSPSKLTDAITDLIDYYKWEQITILYQESTGLNRIENLLKLSPKINNAENSKFRIILKQLSLNTNDWQYILKETKKSGSSHIIVDVETKNLNLFLKIAEELGLMTSYFHFMFTTLDLSILDYSPSANVTACKIYFLSIFFYNFSLYIFIYLKQVQLIEPNDLNVVSILAEFNLYKMREHKETIKHLPSEAAFIYDAFLLIANTIDKNNLSKMIHLSLSKSVSCQTENQWFYGIQFMKYLIANKINGLSGHIEFDIKSGYRTNLKVSIVDRTDDSVELVSFIILVLMSFF